MDIKKRAINALASALDKFRVDYTMEGLNEVTYFYVREKYPLIQQLRKHPDWNEEAMAVIKRIDLSPEETLRTEQRTLSALERYVEDEGFSNLAGALRYFSDVSSGKTITEEAVGALTRCSRETNMFPTLPAIGMKVSRYIRRLCGEHGVDIEGDRCFRSLFARYSDAVNPQEITRPYIFSVNPADYALMSYGNSWSSCHSIKPSMMSSDSSGMYMAGCFSYMCDETTIISYEVSSLPENMAELCLMAKISRQALHIDIENMAFIQSRAYPSGNREKNRKIRYLLHEVLSTVGGFTNMWSSPKRIIDEMVDTKSEYHYPDYLFHGDARLSVRKEIFDSYDDMDAYIYENTINIGSVPRCLMCGVEDIYGTGMLYCSNCYQKVHERRA